MKQLGMFILLAAATLFGMTACGVYDDTDDCKTSLRLKLYYDYNMAFADAFAHEVKTARIYVYDESGKLVLTKTGEVSSDGTVNVDELQTDVKYNIVVWAEGEDRGDSYDFGSSDSQQQLTARVKRSDATVGDDLTPLFHGYVTGQSFAAKYGTTQTIEVPLTKDTNNVKVVLQQIEGGTSVDPDDFTLTITDDNGYLGYDNSLLDDDVLTYTPWSVTTGEAGVDEGDTTVKALIAEFTVNRLFKDGHNPRLIVTNKDGKTVLNIPLIDYFLLVKGEHYSNMSDQEYLDREDTWDLVFFINQDRWVNTYIYVNSWRIVLQDIGV